MFDDSEDVPFDTTATETKKTEIDEAELEVLLKTVGSTVIEELRFDTRNVFASYEKGCKYIWYSTFDI
jgi:hypothetical protein